MKSWIVVVPFDGAKFAARYGLDALAGDFSMNGNVITVKPDHLITDDPPIFEPPDPPKPQGTLEWQESDVPGTLRLVAKFNGKTSAIVGLVGADASPTAMYQSPGPIGPQPAGPRREFHCITKENIVDIPVSVIDGDTLYIEGDGEYRFSGGVWRRILTGPPLGTVGDVPNVWAALEATLDAAINQAQGPQIDPRIKAVLVELRKVL